VEYPYGCFEQRASKILPLILGEDVIIQKGLLKTKSKDDLRKMVTDVLQEFPAYYNNSGFSYWKDGSILEKAALVYFDKHLYQCDLLEQSFLISMVKAPEKYNPYTINSLT
jgi:hypothetical protein